MRDGSLRLVAALAAALGLFVPATIAGAALNDVGTVTAATGAYDETATAWFVELRGAPTAKGGNTDALRAEHAAFKAAAKSEGVSLTEPARTLEVLAVAATAGQVENTAVQAGATRLGNCHTDVLELLELEAVVDGDEELAVQHAPLRQ